MILLVDSKSDIASLNIAKCILEKYEFKQVGEFQGSPVRVTNVEGKEVRLVTLNQELVNAQHLPESFTEPDLVVFISRHSSESGRPTLSVHTPGNLDQAELGGIKQKLSISPANAMRDALKALERLKNARQLHYEVSYEGTHHGPSLEVPTMFIELGSSLPQWSDLKAAETVADAAIEAIAKFGVSLCKTVIGVGGPHYNTKFSRLALENELAFGHMIPKYAIPKLDAEMLQQCVRKTLEKVDHIILDWKGVRGEDKPRLTQILTEASIEAEKI